MAARLPSVYRGLPDEIDTGDDDETLERWANDLDRPLARALAFERRDVISEMLANASSLAASSAPELAREASIPLSHAELLIKGARANGSAEPPAVTEGISGFLPE